MRKHIKALFSGVFCLALAFSAACGSPTGQKPGDRPGGGGSGGGGGRPDGGISVRDNINELGDNVDNMPYIGELDNGDMQPMSLQRETLEQKNAPIGEGSAIVGGQGTVENPKDPNFPGNQPGANWGTITDTIHVENMEDDIFYSAYAESRAYVSPCADLYYIGGANNALEFKVKYVKQNVFEHVRMLNRWIRWTDNTMLRMSYDQANNVLTCEELMEYEDPYNGPYFHYQATTSSYTPDGKEIIEYILTHQRSIGDNKYAQYYRYIEDKEQLYFTRSDEDMYGVVYSDLSRETPLTTAFAYQNMGEYEGLLQEQITKEIYIPQTENDCGYAANVSYNYSGGVMESYYYQTMLINDHGLQIGVVNELQYYGEEAGTGYGANVSVNLPYVTNLDYSIHFDGGVDVARFHEDWEYQDSIRNYDYIGENVTYQFNINGISFTSRDDQESLPYYSGYGMLMSYELGVYVEDENDLLSYMEDVNFQLEENCQAQVERHLNRKEFLASNSIYGYTLDSEISREIIHNIFLRFIKTFSHVSDEELQSFQLSSALPENQQTEDENYYLIYDVQFSGSISYDVESESVDASNVVATMPKNLALDGGETLALVAVYTTGCESVEIGRKTFTYNNETLTMSFNEIELLYIPELNGEGQINFYVINISTQSMRVSSIYNPTCASDVDTLIVSGSHAKRLFIQDDMLYVRQADSFTINVSVDGQTVNNPIHFVQASGVFVDGDTATVAVMNGETQVGEFTYDFAQNINPEAITLDSGVATDSLYYVLNVYNANGSVIYTYNF